MFEELFAPGRKHTNDERKRLELTRVDLNDGDPGRGPIDLSSGKVVVRPPGRTEAQPETEPESEAEPEAGTSPPEASGTAAAVEGPAPARD
ncbi:DUF6191 domain-containing protein [Streptomyces sp. YJ-C3]